MLQNLTEQELHDLRAAIALDYSDPVSRFRAVTVDPQERLLVVFESDRGDRTERVAALFGEGIEFHPLATVPAPVQIGTATRPLPEPPPTFSESPDGVLIDCDAVFEFGEPLDFEDMKAFIKHDKAITADYALPPSLVELLAEMMDEDDAPPDFTTEFAEHLEAILLEPYEFAGKAPKAPKAGGKKNCTPGKSHFCQRQGGAGTCLPVSKKCGYKPEGDADAASGYVADMAPKVKGKLSVGESAAAPTVATKAEPKTAPKAKAEPKPKAEPKAKKPAESQTEAKPKTNELPGGSESDYIKESMMGGYRVNVPDDLAEAVKDTSKYGTAAKDYLDPKVFGKDADTKEEAIAIARDLKRIRDHVNDPEVPTDGVDLKSAAQFRKGDPIKSQKDFDAEVDKALDSLVKDGLEDDNSSRIYMIRRALGGRVSRGDFDKFVAQKVASGDWEYVGGSVEDTDPNKIVDSVNTEISGIRALIRRRKK